MSNREQDIGLDSLMKSLQLLTLQGQLFGANRSDAEPRAKELVDLVRLTGAIDRRVGTYSGSSYLGFILPLSIVSSAPVVTGLACQNLVRNLESGYFYNPLLTRVSRASLLLGPFLAGALILALQTSIVMGVGMLIGLEPVTGIRGLLAGIGIALLLGVGFAGFTVSTALGSGSAAVTQSAGFIFFPLTFLTASFVPLELLDGWLKTAARVNPITYVLGSIRDTLNVGWISTSLW